MRAAALAALLFLAAPASVLAAGPGSAQHLTSKSLTIETVGGGKRYQVEIATTPEQQEIGLMFRRTMRADHGMIFPMSPPRGASFWMKNTFIPLDMVFIRRDGTISSIAANCTPLSLTPVFSDEPVGAVLELKGGEAKKAGIRPGDRVRW